MQRLLVVLGVLAGLFFLQNTFSMGAWQAEKARATHDAQAAKSAAPEVSAPVAAVPQSEEGVRVVKAVQLALERDRQARIARVQWWMEGAKAKGGVCEPISADNPEYGYSCVYPENAKRAFQELRDKAAADGFQPVKVN